VSNSDSKVTLRLSASPLSCDGKPSAETVAQFDALKAAVREVRMAQYIAEQQGLMNIGKRAMEEMLRPRFLRELHLPSWLDELVQPKASTEAQFKLDRFVRQQMNLDWPTIISTKQSRAWIAKSLRKLGVPTKQADNIADIDQLRELALRIVAALVVGGGKAGKVRSAEAAHAVVARWSPPGLARLFTEVNTAGSRQNKNARRRTAQSPAELNRDDAKRLELLGAKILKELDDTDTTDVEALEAIAWALGEYSGAPPETELREAFHILREAMTDPRTPDQFDLDLFAKKHRIAPWTMRRAAELYFPHAIVRQPKSRKHK